MENRSRSPGLLCQKLVEIGRDFEAKREAERRKHREGRKQLEKLVEKQRAQILEQRNRFKEETRKHAAEIERYRSQLAELREKVNRSDKNKDPASSISSPPKDVRSLTFEIIALRFEIAELKKENSAARGKKKFENGGASSKIEGGDGKENNNPSTIESKTSPSKSPSVGSESSSTTPEETCDEDEKKSSADLQMYSKEMLFHAAENGMQAVVQQILSPTQNYSEKHLNVPLGTALRKSCIGGNMSVVRSLLSYGADVNATEKETKMSPLHFATKNGRADIVKVLIDEGADIDALDSEDRSPIFTSAESKSADCVELLLFAGCDMTLKDARGRSIKDVCGGPGQERCLRTICDHKMLFWNCCTRGNRVYNLSKHEAALRLFKEALRLTEECKLEVVSKDRATIHYNCARAAIRLDRYLLAVEHCTSAIDLDASFFKAWKLRGESRYKLHNFESSVKDFERAANLNSNDSKLRALLGEARRMCDMDHYTLFGIGAEADASAIKKRYRKLCLKWHPDKNRKGEDHLHRATVMFRRIQEAHKVLIDPCQRILYDMSLNKKSPGAASSSSSSSSSSASRKPASSSSSSSSYRRSPSPRDVGTSDATYMRGPSRGRRSPTDDLGGGGTDDYGTYSDVDASFDYPLVEEEDDLLGGGFGAGDFVDDVFDDEEEEDEEDDEYSSLRNDRMWKLFEEYERSYQTGS